MKIGLKHIDYLTDSFGIWQHTIGRKIDLVHGYALDDSARALLIAIIYGDEKKAKIYTDFLHKSISSKKIVNFYDKSREPLGISWSEDAVGEAYWAAASLLAVSFENQKAKEIIGLSENKIKNFTSVRGKAYAIMGAVHMDLELANILSNSLLNEYLRNFSNSWYWLEGQLSYANAIIPLSFITAGDVLKKPLLKHYGLVMLRFLNSEAKEQGYPMAIGNKGWYRKDGQKAIFDQQPIDVGYQVMANVKAWEITKDEYFLSEAKAFFSWFWGNNLIQKPLLDKKDQSCRDGLWQTGVDQNRGAESIICYLLAQESIWPYMTQYEKDSITNI